MKRYLSILLFLLSFVVANNNSNASGTIDYGSSALSASGAGTQDAVNGIDDLSYDEAESNYSINVICPINITPEGNNQLDLGYLNPDGSRMLPKEYLQWKVKGGNGWYFEAWLKNDQFATGATVGKTNNVYFVNPYWTYKIKGGSHNAITETPVQGDYDMEYHIPQLKLSGNVGPDNKRLNPCRGKGIFRFHPNQVVATELAVADHYTWNIFMAVDYLTWTTPVNPDNSAYGRPPVAQPFP